MSDRGKSFVSRRDFVVRTGMGLAAWGAATRLGTSTLLAADENPPGKKLGFAFVGIGSLCMNQLLPGIMKSKYCKPVALVSGHPDKAKAQAQKYNIDPRNIYNYDNYDSIKDNPEIDVVYVVLPNGMHPEYTIRAAKAGKHVLCEKPMANSAKDCQAMIDACKAAGKRLQIGYRLHFEPNTLACIDALRKKQVGDIQLIENGAGFVIGDPTQWRLNKKLAGGGCMMDIGIYALNAARYLSGEEPTEISAQTYQNTNDPRFKEVEQHCNFQLRFRSGVLASCSSSYNTGLNRFVAHGTRGWADLDPGLSYSGVKCHISGRGQPRAVDVPMPENFDQFGTEMDGLAMAIANNTPSRASGEEGLQDMKIIQAIYESARTGKAVKM